MTLGTPGLPTSVIAERIVRVLSRFFLESAAGDAAEARLAATQMLHSYQARTGADLLLVAQIIAFGFAALDNLSQSFADPELTLARILRLRGNANALNRAAQQCRRALDRRTDPARQHEPVQPAGACVSDDPVEDAEVEAVLRRVCALLGQTDLTTDLTVAEGAPEAAVMAGASPAIARPPVAGAVRAEPNAGARSTRLERRAAKWEARAQRHVDIQRRNAERAAAEAARLAEGAPGEVAAWPGEPGRIVLKGFTPDRRPAATTPG